MIARDAVWMASHGTLHAVAERIGTYAGGEAALRALCGAVFGRRRPVDPDRSTARPCPYCLAALGRTARPPAPRRRVS